MTTDPYAAFERQRQREAAHRRRQQSQREDLREAARLLIPDHGMSVTLAQLAVQARISRHVAAGLVLGVADLAVDLVCRAWHAMIEATAPTPGATPEHFLARLIECLRAEAPAHRVWQAIHCGLPPRHQESLAAAEALLDLATGEGLRELCPDLPGHSATLGGRVLALARHAAYHPARPDSRAEAAVIAALLPLLAAQPAAAPAPPAAHASPPEPTECHHPARPGRSPATPPPAATPPPPAWAIPRPRGQDPPARAA
jgi:hypothetical protein